MVTPEIGVVARCFVIAGSFLSLIAVVIGWRAYNIQNALAMGILSLVVLAIVTAHVGIGVWATWLWTRGRGLPRWAFVAWIVLQLASVPVHLLILIDSWLLSGAGRLRLPY